MEEDDPSGGKGSDRDGKRSEKDNSTDLGPKDIVPSNRNDTNGCKDALSVGVLGLDTSLDKGAGGAQDALALPLK
jgi:hypothetical protein